MSQRADGNVWESCPVGVKHDTEISELKRRMDLVEKAYIDIRDHLLKRPSWAVTLMLSSLMTVCTGLIIYIATH